MNYWKELLKEESKNYEKLYEDYDGKLFCKESGCNQAYCQGEQRGRGIEQKFLHTAECISEIFLRSTTKYSIVSK